MINVLDLKIRRSYKVIIYFFNGNKLLGWQKLLSCYDYFDFYFHYSFLLLYPVNSLTHCAYVTPLNPSSSMNVPLYDPPLQPQPSLYNIDSYKIDSIKSPDWVHSYGNYWLQNILLTILFF